MCRNILEKRTLPPGTPERRPLPILCESIGSRRRQFAAWYRGFENGRLPDAAVSDTEPCRGAEREKGRFGWCGHAVNCRERKRVMLQKGTVIGGIYQIVSEIGKGGTGTIYLGWHLHLQKYVVLKRVAVGRFDEETLRTETDILKNLHHPYLPQIYDFVEMRGEVFTVMDYIEGKDFSKLRPGAANMPETIICKFLTEMAEVLAYIHTNRPQIVHSDIKPENIILRPNGHICLIDFNISLNSNKIHAKGYSQFFSSPEQIALVDAMAAGKRVNYSLDPRTDIYSTGAVAYYLMTGIVPDGRRRVAPLAQMRVPGYSEGLCRIVDRAMTWNREGRYKNGKKLLQAMQTLHRQDSGYRKYASLRAASWIVSAALVAAGAYCLLHGFNQRIRTNYQKDYAELREAVTVGDTDAIGKTALKLLNESDYQYILNERTEDKAGIERALGLSYERAGNETQACAAYREALDLAKEAARAGRLENADLSDYYTDYVISLVETGDTGTASAAIGEARAAGLDSKSLLLADASMRFSAEDYPGCIATVGDYLDGETDAEKCADACLLAAKAAQAEDDADGEISWLEKAADYSGTVYYLEKLAGNYYARSQDVDLDKKKQQEYGQKAIDTYRKISELPAATLDDRITYAMLLEMNDDYHAAEQVLEACLEDNDADYRVYMYLAFCADDAKNASRAREYAEKAEELMGGDSGSADRSALSRLDTILTGK